MSDSEVVDDKASDEKLLLSSDGKNGEVDPPDADHIHVPVITDGKDLKEEYDTYDEFERDLQGYQQDTHQSFMIKRCDALKNHKHSDRLKFRKVNFECVHHNG
ncbi:hypothetical protein RvY_19538 [Ramazzottius varieornatus]|uniref:ZSWIM3 N-terminal domain-containing protein n=1 Tax=Ramazzottius varieornatus TaxID=947166 RepID=A0A1D1W9N6_RAMVA|nr:hypothetical protein RvY_19538 [Ramazzottius varieornatus]